MDFPYIDNYVFFIMVLVRYCKHSFVIQSCRSLWYSSLRELLSVCSTPTVVDIPVQDAVAGETGVLLGDIHLNGRGGAQLCRTIIQLPISGTEIQYCQNQPINVVTMQTFL